MASTFLAGEFTLFECLLLGVMLGFRVLGSRVLSFNDLLDGIYLQAGHMLAVNGARHINLLGRTGRADLAGTKLESLFTTTWAASVTMTKCDLAFAEDSDAILGRHKHLGELNWTLSLVSWFLFPLSAFNIWSTTLGLRDWTAVLQDCRHAVTLLALGASILQGDRL